MTDGVDRRGAKTPKLVADFLVQWVGTLIFVIMLLYYATSF